VTSNKFARHPTQVRVKTTPQVHPACAAGHETGANGATHQNWVEVGDEVLKWFDTLYKPAYEKPGKDARSAEIAEWLEEDFPTLTEEYTVRGAILAEDPELDTKLLEPSFVKRNLGYFDPRQGGFLIPMAPVNIRPY